MTILKPLEDNLHRIGLEQAVLAALMSIDNSIESLPSGFGKEAFYSDRHQIIYTAIESLGTAQKPYDALMVHGWLVDHRQDTQAGGEPYLMELLANSPASLFNLPEYAKTLLDLLARRKALAAIDKARLALLTDTNSSAADVIGGALTASLESFDHADNREPVNLKQATQRMVSRIQNPVMRRGYDTGFYPLTAMTSGFSAGQLIVIAARPGLGKTTLALNMLDAVMLSSKKLGLFFSMEMSADELMDRYVSSLASVPLSAIKTGQMSEAQESEVWRVSAEALQSRNLIIDDRERRTPQDILMTARKYKRQSEIGAIVVDYLQLMSSPAHSGDRTQEVGEISRSLKALAKQLGCPVIALAQLNREVTKFNRKPRLSDIRESGQIEQDADIVMFLHRDEPKEDKDGNAPPCTGVTELILAKHRNGAVGTIKLVFQGQYSRYVDLTPDALVGG